MNIVPWHRRAVGKVLRVFKKKNGRWTRFRGNPYKKHIIRGRNPLKHNIAMGFHDKDGNFHPIRSSPDYSPGRVGEKRAKRKTTRRKKHTAAKKRRR